MTNPELEDLPPEVLEQLSPRYRNDKNNNFSVVQDLFLANGNQPMSVDEILVELYRANGEIYKRQSLLTLLSYHVNTGRLRRVAKGVYMLED